MSGNVVLETVASAAAPSTSLQAVASPSVSRRQSEESVMQEVDLPTHTQSERELLRRTTPWGDASNPSVVRERMKFVSAGKAFGLQASARTSMFLREGSGHQKLVVRALSACATRNPYPNSSTFCCFRVDFYETITPCSAMIFIEACVPHCTAHERFTDPTHFSFSAQLSTHPIA